jgi:hypothetical protein
MFVPLVGAAAVPTADNHGWIEVAPKDTHCWDGAPWHFWYHPGDPNKLAIWFQGGGACWNAETCDVAQQPTFDTKLGSNDYPGRGRGLFDQSHKHNPLQDFGLVLLPYCTGDMHIGERSVEYTRADGSKYRFAHAGQKNVAAALDALQALRLTPATLFVGGASTGAVGAAFWANDIGNRWPNAQLIVVGDAAGGYRSRATNGVLKHWGALDNLPDVPAYRDPKRIYFETFYVAAGAAHPTARLAQVNYANDAVQRHLMTMLGTSVPQLTKPLQCNLNEVRIETPGFHSFIYPGTQHEMLRTNAVYTTRCEKQTLIGWISDLIAGRPVETHWCDGTLTLHTNTAALKEASEREHNEEEP